MSELVNSFHWTKLQLFMIKIQVCSITTVKLRQLALSQIEFKDDLARSQLEKMIVFRTRARPGLN